MPRTDIGNHNMSDDSDDGTTPASAGAANTGQTSPSEIVEATKQWSQVAKSFLFVEVSSLVLMFACIGVWSIMKGSLLSYALSVSVVSLAACLIIQTGEFVKPGLLEKVEKPVSLALFVWWAIGTGVITFRGPFVIVGNGYFSAWAGLIFTTHWALNIDTSKFTELDKGQKTLALFMLAAAIEMFACIPFLTSKVYTGQAAWGLTAGVVTLIICGVIFRLGDDANAQMVKISAILMFAIWATVAGVCTFDGPFINAGNGYFASWGGCLASMFYLQYVLAREDEIV